MIHEPKPTMCPACHSFDTMPLDGGLVLCFECRHEWNPDTEPSPAALVAVPARMGVLDAPTADDVLGPPAGVPATDPQPAHVPSVVGTPVILEGGQRATIVELIDDDTCIVELGDGRHEQVDFGVIERSTLVPVIDLPDEDAAALGSTYLAIMSLTLDAGLATLDTAPAGAMFGIPPLGWLPDDPGASAVIEQGVAYAVATIVAAFGIDREQIARTAERWRDAIETDTNEKDE